MNISPSGTKWGPRWNKIRMDARKSSVAITMQRRRLGRVSLLLIFCLFSAVLTYTYKSIILTTSSSVSSAFSPSLFVTVPEPSVKTYQALPQTSVLAHAPGFTVFENLYWRNFTYYILTDRPWSIPDVTLIASRGFEENHDPKNPAVQVMALRNAAVAPEVREENQLGKTIGFEQARKSFGMAEVLEGGPMMINNDDKFVAHYYHWIGELFLGIWRIWSHYALVSGKPLDSFKTLSFTNQFGFDDAPIDVDRNSQIWNDSPGANEWFTAKFFPGITFETRGTWLQRAATNQYYRLPLTVLADRTGGHNGPSSAYKPWGDVLRLPVHENWLTILRDRVLSRPLRPASKPVVTYLERQGSGRSLREKDHERFVNAMKKMEVQDEIEFNVRSFNSSIPFDDQVAEIARTDILVSVHGNGLTHSIWMSPGPGKAIFEFQPRSCTINDYSPLAIAAGVQHHMVHEDNYCFPEDCPNRHCDVDNGINDPNIRLEPSVVVNRIREILKSSGMTRE